MKKITFKFTINYNQAVPNNGFPEETDYIETDGVYDFSDYLSDNGVQFEREDDMYYVIEDDERTGAAYMIINEEETEN